MAKPTEQARDIKGFQHAQNKASTGTDELALRDVYFQERWDQLYD